MQATTAIRRLTRRTLPLEFRQAVAQMRRQRRDRAAGVAFARRSGGEEWSAAITLSQPIMPSPLFQNKLSNLGLGSSLVDLSLIEPGDVWSFWDRVGKPAPRNGFVEGRNLVDGRLVRQVGGGLCQLSSLLYHLALLGGLEIVERHAHSIDIYREEDRFTPLGADATVVWGFKDLRLRNPHQLAVSIRCVVEGDRLRGEIRSPAPLAERDVLFIREGAPSNRVHVRTIVNGIDLIETEYIQYQGMALS